MSPGERRGLVDRDDPDLSVAAQCRLLKVARSTLYYQPVAVDADDLALMRRMDELYTKPFYGSRRMVAESPVRLMCCQPSGARWASNSSGTVSPRRRTASRARPR